MSTETTDPRFLHVATWPTATAVEAMLEGQLSAIAALHSQVAAIAAASDAAAARLKAGGRLCYAGAGTSGRIAVQDGVELRPTFDWPKDRLVFLLAGGTGALTESAEGAEDDGDAARAGVATEAIGANDVLIGVAASGTTPFTLAAIEAARAAGALTIAVANNSAAPLLAAAEHAILAETGSEIVAGSTRMKAGTAQKAALNMISTAIMLRLGFVHRGLMVNMRMSNTKLRRRGAAIVAEIAGVSIAEADGAIEAAGRHIPRAVLIALGETPDRARHLLDQSGGSLSQALATRQG
ncbi:N-acetylmuramic acid 6-phosphate etherase [Sphingomonas sp. Leaf357]|uniref:N-acetylmuramic acid 6-phosphate etherase n=1 Tax=Sphingomonas sp. Leaf357 TaxID=1736350 RepID=UPI0007009C9A|nr:N-acetylmuramic acid 6-phosphate etherase [Sphingomonas sp. Leaf357]KQS05065.1 N-acetylmuramic acid 6-phosphate etherase [Sphingomonas sp. Leaf357]